MTVDEFWFWVFVVPLIIFALLILAETISRRQKERDKKIEELEAKVKKLEED